MIWATKGECSQLDDCRFFNGGFKGHSLGEFLVREFCHDMPHYCAIHIAQQSLRKEQVPDDLLPHELDRIKRLL